ncbi:MAG: DUF1553 domain-containing protein [Pedosphaera sp.]|nr:DUF1553 domain-containing protein [Pedosphaera sp.]
MNSIFNYRPVIAPHGRKQSHFRYLQSSVSAVMVTLVAFSWGALDLIGAPLSIHYRAGATQLVLGSSDAGQQMLALDEGDRDVTRKVRWTSQPEGIVRIDRTGRVSVVANGTAILRATTTNGVTAEFPVRVEHAEEPAPIHFANQIVPIFTKNGCNGGGCHGKAAGQNGFRLSLLGFEPEEDYEHLVREARGRRLFPADPARSLLITKGAAVLPHGGGKRLELGSDDYDRLIRWIGQGMPMGQTNAPTVSRVEVYPAARTLAVDSEQQLVITAHYSDGSTEDVTRSALFEPNDKDMAATDSEGRVRVFSLPGEFAVMVRYQAKVATFRATIPLGAPVESLPVARSFIDDLIFKQLKKVGMPPSGVSDDATFLRRVTLDIAGRLPTADEVRSFSIASATNRRDAAIERLLASPSYADYFANKWAALLRNKRSEAKQARGTVAFHAWIRDSLSANKPYDQFVHQILTASGDMIENPPVAWYRQVRTMQTQLEDVSQLFLGQRMQCAQCHHHPYEKWSQTDYWSFGAAFSQVTYKTGSQPGEDVIVHRRGEAKATNKKNGQMVKAAALAEPAFKISTDDDPRQFLADWMTSPKNPWFAKAVVNRYWKHFFGRGLVDPEDDMRVTNPPTHPELLEALAARFVESGFDLKELVRTLAQSTTYQLSAEPNAYNGRDRHQFSRFYPRRLPAEVLFDSVNGITGSQSQFEGLPAGTRAICLPDNSFNASSYFLTVFGRPEGSSACECERSMGASLSQSLHLLNSKDIQTKLGSDTSRPARLAADTRTDEAKLSELYTLAFGRMPTSAEAALSTAYVAKKLAALKVTDSKELDAARTKVRREAWEDTVWALLNSKEFLFNH